jgi:alpha-methylacyl-CoA racemase
MELNALQGYRVLAFATYIPAPVAVARLHRLGASVTKIEPLQGDPLQPAAPAWYAQLTTGIDVRRMHLRDAEATTQIDAMLADADVVVTAMRARSLAALGIEASRLRARFPRVSHVALVGEAAPHEDRPGHDLTYQARAGTIAPPAMPRVLIADMAAAERLVSTVIGALLKRERCGEPTYATVGITDAAAEFALAYEHGLTQPGGELGGALPGYRIYRAADGWVALAALEPHFAERTRDVLGLESLDASAIEAAFLQRTAQAWEQLAEQHDLPLAAIR